MARDRPRKTRAVLWFHRILRWTLGPYMVWRFRLRGENQEIVRKLKPPYLVIPNHVMTFDPFLVNYFIPYPVHYVASDANFRSPLGSFLLRQVGKVPFKEIAAITGVPENTVKSRMRYALERLQDALSEYEDYARALR